MKRSRKTALVLMGSAPLLLVAEDGTFTVPVESPAVPTGSLHKGWQELRPGSDVVVWPTLP